MYNYPRCIIERIWVDDVDSTGTIYTPNNKLVKIYSYGIDGDYETKLAQVHGPQQIPIDFFFTNDYKNFVIL